MLMLFCIFKYTQKLFSTTTTLKMSTTTVVNDHTDPTSEREPLCTFYIPLNLRIFRAWPGSACTVKGVNREMGPIVPPPNYKGNTSLITI